jgi:hypothetical protein
MVFTRSCIQLRAPLGRIGLSTTSWRGSQSVRNLLLAKAHLPIAATQFIRLAAGKRPALIEINLCSRSGRIAFGGAHSLRAWDND